MTSDSGTPTLYSVVDPKAGPRWGGHVPSPPTPDPPPDDQAPPPLPDGEWPVPIDHLLGCRVDVTAWQGGWVTAIVFNPRMTHVVGVDVLLKHGTRFIPWVYLNVHADRIVASVPGEDFAGLAVILEHGARIRRSGAETSTIRVERDGRVNDRSESLDVGKMWS